MEKYLQILQEYTSGSKKPDNASVLYKTKWIRILVVPTSDTDDSATIEVEMSPPTPPSSSISSTYEEPLPSRNLLTLMIEHLKYLLSLDEAGYSIDFAGNGCLLVAFQRFNNIPSVETFRLLLPPTTGS
jgi:hypothetical protein